MSLKGFHIVFIALAILLMAFFAVWCLVNETGTRVGVASAVGAVSLLIYGVWFVKKSRNIIT
jgi:hypothetical protein